MNDDMLDSALHEMNLDEDLKVLYEHLGKKSDVEECEKNIKLTKERNKVYKRYLEIDLTDISVLPAGFDEYVDEILYIYSNMNDDIILKSSLEELAKITKSIDLLHKKKEKLENLIRIYLKILISKNNTNIKKISEDYIDYLDLASPTKKILKNKYKELILKEKSYGKTLYEMLFYELNREKLLYEIEFIINDNIANKFEYNDSNLQIEKLVDSKNSNIDVSNMYGTLKNINEFCYLKLSLEEQNKIKNIYSKIEESENLNLLNNDLLKIVKNIWSKFLTNISDFNNSDFSFICSPSRIIKEKYETILLTRKILDNMSNYMDYQIGFICEYNNNILYTTSEYSIDMATKSEKKNIKIPHQIEKEYINKKVLNKIALNGYETKISAVYFIDDGNEQKYKEAVEISKYIELPLIKIKK